ARERSFAGVTLAQRHQAGHFVLGETDFLAPELREREVFHFVGHAARFGGLIERVNFRGGCCGHHLSFKTPRHLKVAGSIRSLYEPLTAEATNNAGPFTVESTGSDTTRVS